MDAQWERVAWLVLNTEANVEVDITTLDAGEQVRKELTRRGIVFAGPGRCLPSTHIGRRDRPRDPSGMSADLIE